MSICLPLVFTFSLNFLNSLLFLPKSFSLLASTTDFEVCDLGDVVMTMIMVITSRWWWYECRFRKSFPCSTCHQMFARSCNIISKPMLPIPCGCFQTVLYTYKEIDLLYLLAVFTLHLHLHQWTYLPLFCHWHIKTKRREEENANFWLLL